MIRPLLDQKKDELIFISKYVFDFYIQDPSNEDEKFQRIKIRKLIKNLQDYGLDKKKFLDYTNLIKSNLLNVVKYALQKTSEYGLSDQHHFYITFTTNFEKNKISYFLFCLFL